MSDGDKARYLGKGVRKADLLVTVETTEEALEAAEVSRGWRRAPDGWTQEAYAAIA